MEIIDRGYSVLHGDLVEMLQVVPSNSIDSFVTDPPYGLSEINTEVVKDALTAWLKEEPYKTRKRGFMGKEWDGFVPGPEAFREIYRVLKPGGHLVCFAGARTEDLMGISIRLAGFELRDIPKFEGYVFDWVYGSGMNKGLNLSLGIDTRHGVKSKREVVRRYKAGGNAGTSTRDKGGTYSVGSKNSDAVELTVTKGASDSSRMFDGWNTGLKPAREPIILARKPLEGNLVDNALKYGTGGLNIDACRVKTDWEERPASWHRSGHAKGKQSKKIAAPPSQGIQCHPDGRVPANLLLGHHPDCGPRCVIGCPVEVIQRGKKPTGVYGHDDVGAVSRYFKQFCFTHLDWPFFYASKASTRERDAGLELFKSLRARSSHDLNNAYAPRVRPNFTSGLKVEGDLSERKNPHTTVKPVELIRWLVKLVTPPGGIVGDGFTGSGTTGVAAILEGYRFLGVELLDDETHPYVRVAKARIDHALKQVG